jgi:hypothetical protein
MSKYLSFSQFLLSVLSLCRMENAMTITLRRCDGVVLKVRGQEPLQILAKHPKCPQRIGVRLQALCFYIVLKKDMLQALGPVVTPALNNRVNFVRTLCISFITLLTILKVGNKSDRTCYTYPWLYSIRFHRLH